MADQNSSNIPAVTNSFNKGMIKDVNETFTGEGQWTHAINAVNNSHDGQVGVIGNEPSNLHCVDLPYVLIGCIPTVDEQWILFTTNDTDSEIGLFDESKCLYTTLVNDPCLNFSKKNLITGVARRTFDCSIQVYWSDRARNPDRVMDINKIPWVMDKVLSGDCYTEVPTDVLDCEQLRLAPLLDIPCLKLKKANGAGTLLNGSYQVSIAYAINEIRVTDYLVTSNPVSIWSHSGVGGAIELFISETDSDFDEMEVVIISNINGQTVAKRLGIYSTRQEKIYIDNISPSLPTVPLEFISLQTPATEKSDSIYSVSEYLMRVGVYSKPDFNYQPQANKIIAKWEAVEYPSDYYHKGGENVGHMRDEIYSYFIRWQYNTGDRSASYHIPGRPFGYGGAVDTTWLTDNTATITAALSIPLGDGGTVIQEGLMGYWESSDTYPDDNAKVWNVTSGGLTPYDLCGKNIRHHKFPDNTLVPHVSNSGATIIVLGVKFENITHPLDINGNPITSIVGYEILRGSREGNKTVIAKGLLNNMRTYVNRDGNDALFQNYPYNDVTFASLDPYYDSGIMKPAKTDYISFHSPDTTFNHPYLGTPQLRVYGDMLGQSTGSYEVPWRHPEFKILGTTAGTLATVVGVITGIFTFLGAIGGSSSPSLTGTEDVPINIPLSSGATDMLPIASDSIGATGAVYYAANVVLKIASLVLNAAVGAAMGIITAEVTRQKLLDIITGFIPTRQYGAQFNSYGYYNQFVNNNKQTIGIDDYGYIKDGVQVFGGFNINNLYRNDYVLLKLNGSLGSTANPDISLAGILGEVDDVRISQISSRYGAIKTDIRSLYGQIDSIRQIPVTSCTYDTQPISGMFFNTGTTPIFGGDTYINRYTEKNPFVFFNDWLIDQPKDYVYNYKEHQNIKGVRYWVDNRKAYEGFFASLGNFYRLYSAATGGWYVKPGYFYLSCNGTRDFFVESEVNVGYRDWEDEISKRFYDPYGFTDLSSLYRSDVIKSAAYYKYDYSLSVSRLYNQFISWGSVLERSFNPDIAASCYSYYPRRVMYSLPQTEELKKDNWRSFLVNNYKDFSSVVTCIKSVGKTGALILLEEESPIQLTGVDTLQTDAGTKITVGDGGLFNQPLQNITNSDKSYQYGSCQNRYSAIGTPQGLFWVSQDQGKVFQYNGGAEEISRINMKWWFAKYLPSQLLASFPNYDHKDNPVYGVGVQTVYDNTNEILYITKRDYKLKPGVQVEYSPESGFWVSGGTTPIPIPASTTYECPEGYALVNVDGVWTCQLSGPAEDINILKYNQEHVEDPAFGTGGTAIYDPGYIPTSGAGTFTLVPSGYLSDDVFAKWLNTWANAAAYPAVAGSTPQPTTYSTPTPTTYKHDICVNNTTGSNKTYYFAATGKVEYVNLSKQSIDGTSHLNDVSTNIINCSNNSSAMVVSHGGVYALGEVLPKVCNIYPIVLAPGQHKLRVSGVFDTNYQIYPTCIGWALLDNTKQQLLDATSLSDLNIMYSSRELVDTGRFSYAADQNCENGGLTLDTGCEYSCNESFAATEVEIPASEIIIEIEVPVSLCNIQYFEDCSWTVSYDVKNKQWISFHDWHPELMIASKTHFLTSWRPCNGVFSSLWRHNDRYDSYCNFYGVNYPWEVEFASITGATVTTSRSMEYVVECYRYSTNGQDKFHVLDFNFDRAIVRNSEQISGLLKMNLQSKTNPYSDLTYPILSSGGIDILYSKVEQKYRFNQFWDITKDRGEFTAAEFNETITSLNGYNWYINPASVDYFKSDLQRKKFRHNVNKVLLRRNISGNTKMIFKFINNKIQQSPR